MTDKVQKIKEWISKEQDGLMDAQGNFEYLEHEGAYHILCNLDTYIDSLQEEPVSEDFEKIVEEIAEPTILNAYGTKELARRLRNTICGTSESKELDEVAELYTLDDSIKPWRNLTKEAFKAGAKWQFERINEALLSEVLPCFMHGGEADEVVAKLDEVLNKKK